MTILQDFPSEQHLKKIIMQTSITAWKHGLSEKKIEKWLSNFQGELYGVDEERILALWLLCNFVYYNEDEVKHLCSTLLKEYVHQMLLSDKTLHSAHETKVDALLSNTAFLSLGKPSESGAFMLYYFRQVNDLHVSFFMPPEQALASDVACLVFIDDMTLTAGKGGQAYTYLQKFMPAKRKIVLLTLLSTTAAATELDKIGVKVISTITLHDNNKCFAQNSFVFHSHGPHTDACKKFAEHYGKKTKAKMPLGYMDAQLLVGFFYNTPDNTLPILWAKENGWTPIFPRYDKNYTKRNLKYDHRFI